MCPTPSGTAPSPLPMPASRAPPCPANWSHMLTNAFLHAVRPGKQSFRSEWWLITWFPREGTTRWVIHWESTTPIFSWAGCDWGAQLR
jgi:hypothetical protein